MNRARLMHEALRDGDWHTRRDLFEHAGQFYMTNNAASELRARGTDVEQRYFDGNYEYRISSAGDTDPCGNSSSPSEKTAIPADTDLPYQVPVSSVSPVEPEQLRLVA